MKDYGVILGELEELTAAEERLFISLLPHRGLEKAVVGKELARRIGINERDMKRTIAHLRRWHKLPIGSSKSEEPKGYFLIQTADEARLTTRHMWREAINILKVISVIEKQMLPELLGQLRLQWRAEEKGDEESES